MKKIMTLFLSLITLSALGQPMHNLLKPTTPEEYNKVTVMITNLTSNSGGTGVILRSYENTSYILTNKHVCKLLETQEGLVTGVLGSVKAIKYKTSELHDICLLAVAKNLEVSTTVSKVSAKFGDKLIITGHPFLLPTIISEGLSSTTLEVSVAEGLKPCTGEEGEDAIACMLFGGIPIVVVREALVGTNLISPGNSGSAVFNESGEIVGLAFAGSGELSRALIVPREFIVNFLSNEVKSLDWNLPNSNKNKVRALNKETKIVIDSGEKIYVPAIKDKTLESQYEKINKYFIEHNVSK